MNSDNYHHPNLYRPASDPKPEPVQKKFKFWTLVPAGITGLFVILYHGDSVLGFIGPIAGMTAFYALWGLITRLAQKKGATHTELIRKDK